MNKEKVRIITRIITCPPGFPSRILAFQTTQVPQHHIQEGWRFFLFVALGNSLYLIWPHMWGFIYVFFIGLNIWFFFQCHVTVTLWSYKTLAYSTEMTRTEQELREWSPNLVWETETCVCEALNRIRWCLTKRSNILQRFKTLCFPELFCR